MQSNLVGQPRVYGELSDTAFLVSSTLKVLVVFVVLLVVVAMLTLLERKVSAWMQDRLGPNRVGPGGLLQPAADGVKNILKEETNPAQAHRVFFTLAPMLSIIPAMVTFAVIPFAAPLPNPFGPGVIPMVVADVPVGILFLLAFSSLGVYGIVIAGWASSNKYALLGGLRAGAQMISYEIALGLSLLLRLLPGGQRGAHRRWCGRSSGCTSGSRSRSPSRSSSSGSPASPRPTASPSTSPRPSRSW